MSVELQFYAAYSTYQLRSLQAHLPCVSRAAHRSESKIIQVGLLYNLDYVIREIGQFCNVDSKALIRDTCDKSTSLAQVRSAKINTGLNFVQEGDIPLL